MDLVEQSLSKAFETLSQEFLIDKLHIFALFSQKLIYKHLPNRQ